MVPVPEWLRGAVTIASKYGIGTLFAVVLLWRFLGAFEGELKATTAATNQLREQLTAHQAAMDSADAMRRMEAVRQLELLRGICFGVSRGNAQATAFCLR